jgi:ribosomal protein L20A (L18A)
MHKLLYETKAMGKEQYHNNFSCYGFIARPNASHPVPTFRKRWPGAWMEDIKEVIMRPIWSRFGLRRPKIEIDEIVEACQRAFSTVCSFVGTRDLIQEHIAFRVWPLIDSWEMPKETTTDSSEGGLVRLKYTFRFREKFDEPNDDWLKCIEATSDELLGAYSKAEDNALSAAFGGRGKKRLNRVFDAIGFVYPDYRYPLRGHGKKRKTAASATLVEPMPKGKKVKVLTHWSRYIEPAMVPKFGAGTSSATKTKEIVPTARSTEEPAIMPKVPTVKLVEMKVDKAKKPKIEEIMRMPEILSPPTEATVLKVQMGSAVTPKRRRMANVLDVVLETTKNLESCSYKESCRSFQSATRS